jgi:hypothetical protein
VISLALVVRSTWRLNGKSRPGLRPAYRSVARFARAATGTLGTSNSTDTRRDPHSGHISRLSRRERGKFGPRVQTRVCMPLGAPGGCQANVPEYTLLGYLLG